ncbi:MAG: hypothetical protein KDJ44_20330 [Rhodoblastus sp.]|nr:hypothetical protein [Rhodoblastus sp.]
MTTGFTTLVQAQSTIFVFEKSRKRLLRLVVDPKDERNQQEAEESVFKIAQTIMMVGLMAGSRDPKWFALFTKMERSKFAEQSRHKKASQSLPKLEVDAIIVSAFQDRSLTKGAVSNPQKAARILQSVNETLARRGIETGLKAPQYKDAASLSRRFASIRDEDGCSGVR